MSAELHGDRMSDLRDELAAVILDSIEEPDGFGVSDAARAVDALLARYAVLPLPTEHADHVRTTGRQYREWDTGSTGTIRSYKDGTILGGNGYWDTSRGDAPELFAAALVAAARYARGEGQ